MCVCSLPCCSVRDCEGYFIKVHLQPCLRPNHPASKSHLDQSPGDMTAISAVNSILQQPAATLHLEQK